jgi:hypothetical protein
MSRNLKDASELRETDGTSPGRGDFAMSVRDCSGPRGEVGVARSKRPHQCRAGVPMSIEPAGAARAQVVLLVDDYAVHAPLLGFS